MGICETLKRRMYGGTHTPIKNLTFQAAINVHVTRASNFVSNRQTSKAFAPPRKRDAPLQAQACTNSLSAMGTILKATILEDVRCLFSQISNKRLIQSSHKHIINSGTFVFALLQESGAVPTDSCKTNASKHNCASLLHRLN